MTSQSILTSPARAVRDEYTTAWLNTPVGIQMCRHGDDGTVEKVQRKRPSEISHEWDHNTHTRFTDPLLACELLIHSFSAQFSEGCMGMLISNMEVAYQEKLPID